MFYRIQQFWRAIRARPLTTEQWAVVDSVLDEGERPLFRQFSISDQQHSYAVWHMLHEAGHVHPSLQKAALLHDVGKTKVRWYVWDKVIVVLGQKLLPQQSKIWGQSHLVWWRKPFVVREQHALWGAEMAQAAGSEPLTITLIQRHQDPKPHQTDKEEDRLLQLLQWADDLN